MTKKRQFENIAIVVAFAILHFAVAAISRAIHYYDDIPLTVLTITMVIVISMRNNTRTDMMALMTLITTFLGYLIGTWLQEPMLRFIDNFYIAPATSTFLITTILGIGTNYITLRTKRMQNTGHGIRLSTRNIIIIALSILILRMVYVVIDRTAIFTDGMLLESIADIMANTWAILTMLVGNILITTNIANNKKSIRHTTAITHILLFVATITIPTIAAILVYFGLPYQTITTENPIDFIRIYSSTILVDIIIVTICYLVQLTLKSSRELSEEREQKHRSEYQYERLKQQINPHFLFNSLNILDYLVQEHETERASAFIRKLAGIYRYMLNNDSEPLVKLSEELEFTDMYIDLLKERFSEGMVVEREIERDLENRHIVPCAIQLLVENATKHNMMSTEQPLIITITAKGGIVEVKNNLQLRTHGQPSTHLGLENIRRQYLDLTNRDIIVEKTDNEFIVKLPIV